MTQTDLFGFEDMRPKLILKKNYYEGADGRGQEINGQGRRAGVPLKD
jgi:hypothetical protein